MQAATSGHTTTAGDRLGRGVVLRDAGDGQWQATIMRAQASECAASVEAIHW